MIMPGELMVYHPSLFDGDCVRHICVVIHVEKAVEDLTMSWYHVLVSDEAPRYVRARAWHFFNLEVLVSVQTG